MTHQEDLDFDAPAHETKSEAFVRLANFRMEKAIGRMRQMHNLASGNYEYTEDQIDFILAALHGEVNDLERALRKGDIAKEIPKL